MGYNSFVVKCSAFLTRDKISLIMNAPKE